MANLVLLYITVFGMLNKLAESSRLVNSTKMIASKRGVKSRYKEIKRGVNLGLPKNITYFINPKGYSHYEEQFAKIRDIGHDINCKLRGKCLGLRRHKITKETESIQKPFKKSLPDHSRVPDNTNEVVSPQAGLHQEGAELDPQVMANDRRYSNQPNAAEFGQQPQMNLLPAMNGPSAPPDVMSQMRENGDNNDAMIQNSIQNKMEFSDRANSNGPMQMQGNGGGEDGESNRYMGSRHRHHRRHRYDDSGRDKSNTQGLPPQGAPVSDEDMFKAEGVQPNEMNDLHNFLHHDSQKSKSKDDIDRNDDDYDDGGKVGGNTSPEERVHSRHHQSYNDDDDDHNDDNYDDRDNTRRHRNEHEQSFKAGGIEVPNLQNLMGGGMPLMNPNDLAANDMVQHEMQGGGDMENDHGRFIQDNNRNMMESNSDYNLPKSGRKKPSHFTNERHENYPDKHIGMTNRGFKAMESFHNRHDGDTHGMHPLHNMGMMHENFDDDDDDNGEHDEHFHDDDDDDDDRDGYVNDRNDLDNHGRHHRRSYHDHNHNRDHDHGHNHHPVRGHKNAGHGKNVQNNMHGSRGEDDYSMNPINDIASLHDRKGSIPQLVNNVHVPTPNELNAMSKYHRQSGLAPVARETEFGNLWKDYMLTTQSQLAERDPSVNNRGRIHHLDTHKHASYHNSKWNDADDADDHGAEVRWKKSNGHL